MDPETPAQWQVAVDLAAAARAIIDCAMYGLIEGEPKFDIDRCDEILERGRAMGVRPSRPATELALELARSINAEAGKND